MITLLMICETPACERNGSLVNRINIPNCEVSMFVEGYGHGAEDAEHDHCPACKTLATLEFA